MRALIVWNEDGTGTKLFSSVEATSRYLQISPNTLYVKLKDGKPIIVDDKRMFVDEAF